MPRLRAEFTRPGFVLTATQALALGVEVTQEMLGGPGTDLIEIFGERLFIARGGYIILATHPPEVPGAAFFGVAALNLLGLAIAFTAMKKLLTKAGA